MPRERCTKKRPYTPTKERMNWSHPDAQLKEDVGEVYTTWYVCPNCKITFGVRVSA
jgi:hypothetical protein